MLVQITAIYEQNIKLFTQNIFFMSKCKKYLKPTFKKYLYVLLHTNTKK